MYEQRGVYESFPQIEKWNMFLTILYGDKNQRHNAHIYYWNVELSFTDKVDVNNKTLHESLSYRRILNPIRVTMILQKWQLNDLINQL